MPGSVDKSFASEFGLLGVSLDLGGALRGTIVVGNTPGRVEAISEDIGGILGKGAGGGELAVAAATVEPQRCLADGALLKRAGIVMAPKGIRYYVAKQEQQWDSEWATWGSTVAGFDDGDGWVKVGEKYLPTTFCGKQVFFGAGVG